jgi:hypothetical protein
MANTMVLIYGLDTYKAKPNIKIANIVNSILDSLVEKKFFFSISFLIYFNIRLYIISISKLKWKENMS